MIQPSGTINVGRSSSGGVLGGALGNNFHRGNVCPACGGDGAADEPTGCEVCKGQGTLINHDDCMEAYERWLRDTVRKNPVIAKLVDELAGKTLFCPGCGVGTATCHARRIEKIAAERLLASYHRAFPNARRIGPRGKLSLIQAARDPACSKCELHKSSVHRCIMGRGSPVSPIVLVGEAPGESESTSGQPFCGRSGQWMQEKLAELGMDGLVYITNAAKCRPPKNRKPEPFELATCRPYLQRELEIIEPRVVVLLGKTAMETLKVQTTPRHVIRHDPRFRFMLVATWHPAYCLRMGKSSMSARQFVGALEQARRFAQRSK